MPAAVVAGSGMAAGSNTAAAPAASHLSHTMGSRRFCLSTGRHGLHVAAEQQQQLQLGGEVMLAFSVLPHSHTTALPTRWSSARNSSSSSGSSGGGSSSSFGWGRQRGRPVLSVDQQVLSFVPAHRPVSVLQGAAVGDLAAAAAFSSAAAAPLAPPPAGAAAGGAAAGGLLQQQQQAAPWLGSDLQIAGYTKRGYMRGGGKEHNQDRGLILERFRSDGELLLGVLDGHGTHGHLVSSYLVQHLPAVLMNKIVAAAAALLPGHKQQQQGPEQQQQQQQAEHRVPYMMVPAHAQQHHSGGSGGGAAAAGAASALHALRPSKPVGRHKLVQPQRPPASGGSSAVSSWEDAADAADSSGGAVGVPLSLVAAAPLTQPLLSAAFAEADHMLAGSGINVLDSGSTALLVHVNHDTLTTAWVGDSRAVLGRRAGRGWVALPLSDDHKPERPDEQLRIVMNNGLVQQMSNGAGEGVGPYRVWFRELPVYPGLAMSRAFGDLPCRRIGVTAEPQLAVTPLTPADGLLIAATDGVWEYLSNEEAVAIAGACASADEAARQLVEESERRWLAVDGGNYIDDITAVVVRVSAPAGGGRTRR